MIRVVIALALLAVRVTPVTADTVRGFDVEVLMFFDGKRVAVRDFTPDAQSPVWQTIVSQADALMPRHAPRFVYHDENEQPCWELLYRDQHPKHPEIVICEWSAPDFSAFWGIDGLVGVAPTIPDPKHRRVIDSSIVMVGDGLALDEVPACHEFMHALIGIMDRPSWIPEQPDSCVWGQAREPGAFDADAIRAAYRHNRNRHDTD